jgi:hypothetical protein
MKRRWNPEARALRLRWGPVAVLVLANILLGAWLAPHYGQSTDEAANIIFARGSLESYQHPADPYVDPTREDKGPFYLMVWLKGGEFFQRTFAGWAFVDGRHLVNFLAFQLAIVAVYALALRFTAPWAALAATLLFETQPVLFGHAFINQKDSPFMAFFALSMVLGIYAVDRMKGSTVPRNEASRPEESDSPIRQAFRAAWMRDPRGGLRAAILAPALAFGIPLSRLALNRPVQGAIDGLVRAAYDGVAWPPINELFRRFAEHAAQVEPAAYVRRAGLFFDISLLVISCLMIPLAIAVGAALWPEGRRRVWPILRQELRAGVGRPFPWLILAAGVVLGMSLAIRSVALYAGLLIGLYALVRAEARAVFPLIAYFATAALTAVLLWPQLWGGIPVLFAESLTKTIQFPELRRTLFEGVAVLSDELPPWYLPELMAIQFTLPAVFLIAAGIGVAVVRRVQAAFPAALFWVVAFWILGPFLAVVAFGMPIYNYFRHVLFMMPPLFAFAALGFELLLRPLRGRWPATVLAGILLVPGIAAIVRLHPYEYGYFNELVGGVRGAYGRYMSDYWCTSTREAMSFVNEYAPRGAGVAVSSATSNAVPFARPDLLVKDDAEIETDPDFKPLLILGCSWATVNPSFYPDAPTLFQVERDGVPLVIVKQLRP